MLLQYLHLCVYAVASSHICIHSLRLYGVSFVQDSVFNIFMNKRLNIFSSLTIFIRKGQKCATFAFPLNLNPSNFDCIIKKVFV